MRCSRQQKSTLKVTSVYRAILSVPDFSGNDDNNLLVHTFRSNHIALWPLYAARDRILNEKQAVGAEEKSVSLGDAFCPGDQIERWQ